MVSSRPASQPADGVGSGAAVRPDLPTVAVAVDVPLPSDPWVVRTDELELGHAQYARCMLPCRSARQGQSYSTRRTVTRRAGNSCRADDDLEWATDGTPYKYRLATRYEIPCTVSGP